MHEYGCILQVSFECVHFHTCVSCLSCSLPELIHSYPGHTFLCCLSSWRFCVRYNISVSMSQFSALDVWRWNVLQLRYLRVMLETPLKGTGLRWKQEWGCGSGIEHLLACGTGFELQFYQKSSKQAHAQTKPPTISWAFVVLSSKFFTIRYWRMNGWSSHGLSVLLSTVRLLGFLCGALGFRKFVPLKSLI